MPHPRKLLFVLTDGGRARFVRHVSDVNDFATLEEIDQMAQLKKLRAELRASPSGRAFESASASRHEVGRNKQVRESKEAFMAEVAERALATVERLGLEAIFIAAPARLVGVLRGRLESRATVAGALGKDLTKTPDHELHAWLDSALLRTQTSG